MAHLQCLWILLSGLFIATLLARLNSIDLEAARDPLLEEAIGIVLLRYLSDMMHVSLAVRAQWILWRIGVG